MKIVGFSINPLFPDQVIGGSAKHQRHVLTYLGELGHEVTVLCAQRPDSRPFHWHERVRVLPVLPFKHPFPEPYAVPAYKIAEMVQTLGEHLAQADRFYMHDGEWLIPYLYQDVPTVISLRDNVYPETILGSFLFAADTLIAIAEYSRQVYLHTAGRFLPDLPARCVTINNGIDFNLFRPGAPSRAICELTGVDPDQHFIILHPHRPEPDKGMAQTIAVAERLVQREGCHTLRVLAPRWFDERISAGVRDYYASVQQEIAARNLTEHFIFHPWVPQSLMPDYYRLGDLTLVLGAFVEAFGNVAYESLACGTPAIVARVATHRSLLPDALIDKVHYDDHDAAARLAAAVWRERRPVASATQRYLHTHFDVQTQLEGYARVILQARKREKVERRVRPLTMQTRYRLAPWCYTWGEGMVFHDFLAQHTAMPALSQLAASFPAGWQPADAAQLGVEADTLRTWYQAGYVTPVVEGATMDAGATI